MKKWFAAAVLGAMAVSAVVLRINQHAYGRRNVTVGGRSIAALVADTPDKRSKGLGGRRSLGADQGMLFLFDSDAQYGFWMKDMKFPIDIIWINDGEIVDIAPDVQPPPSPADEMPSFLPRLPADTVLEVNAGFAQANGVKIGDAVEVGKVDSRQIN